VSTPADPTTSPAPDRTTAGPQAGTASPAYEGTPVDAAGSIDPLEPYPASVDWKSVSPRLIVIEELALAAVVAAALLGCLVAWASWHSSAALAAAVSAVLLGAVRAVLIVRSVRRWGYAERADDLLVRHGLLVRRLSIVPYARMQFVDVTAGPLQRAFGLATVELHTAAAASDARIPGLPGREAARLRDRLSALGETRAEGL
jgi:membrane protein YdbS with pleckstrin-like domain